jgi:hypothetical protein
MGSWVLVRWVGGWVGGLAWHGMVSWCAATYPRLRRPCNAALSSMWAREMRQLAKVCGAESGEADATGLASWGGVLVRENV